MSGEIVAHGNVHIFCVCSKIPFNNIESTPTKIGGKGGVVRFFRENFAYTGLSNSFKSLVKLSLVWEETISKVRNRG